MPEKTEAPEKPKTTLDELLKSIKRDPVDLIDDVETPAVKAPVYDLDKLRYWRDSQYRKRFEG